jgi:hypothetical protein
MSKGGSPMGSGGFGGQQGGFGGGFGGPQGGFGGGFGGQQGGFGGGFGMPQQQQGYGGGGGGYRPSRQRFNQMPQQQMGYGGGFGGQMQGFGMPQQQQGFGNTFARTMPPQQGFGGGYGMPQRPMYGGDTPMAPQQRDPMRPMVSQMAPEQTQQSATPAPSTDMRAMMDPFRQQANQMMAAQNAALASRGMPTSDALNVAQPPKQQPQAQTNQPSATPSQLYDALRGMDPRALQPNVNRLPTQPQTPPNPYAQQVRQEDPRMQAMRMMQQMRFGGGGYNF